MKNKQLTALLQLYQAFEVASSTGLLRTLEKKVPEETLVSVKAAITVALTLELGTAHYEVGEKLPLKVGDSVVHDMRVALVEKIFEWPHDSTVSIRFDGKVKTTTASYPNIVPLAVCAGGPKSALAAGVLANQVEDLLKRLRLTAIEPMSIGYSDLVDIEVRPIGDDDRVLVGRNGWGETVVNYTTEGLIVDVHADGTQGTLSTQNFYQEDLEEAIEVAQ